MLPDDDLFWLAPSTHGSAVLSLPGACPRQTMPDAGQPASARHAGVRDRMSNCKRNTSTTVNSAELKLRDGHGMVYSHNDSASQFSSGWSSPC